jgi:hypothetical protein
MVSNDALFKKLIAAASSADALAETLRSRDFTHLLIRFDYFRYFIFDYLSEEKRNVFRDFLETRTNQLFSEGVYYVFEITGSRNL